MSYDPANPPTADALTRDAHASLEQAHLSGTAGQSAVAIIVLAQAVLAANATLAEIGRTLARRQYGREDDGR